ncbi:MAG: ankyrin repeat domain-containing protein [Blastocatellales bacterium]
MRSYGTKLAIVTGIVITVGVITAVAVMLYSERFLSPDDWQQRLSSAAREGNIQLMKRAIAHGADVNKFCCGMFPPLNSAAMEGHLEAAQYLVSRGANVNIGDKFHGTPLMEASRGGHIEVVRFLLHHGADPNAIEYMNNSSVLDWAEGNPEIIRLLKERGAVIEHPGIWENVSGKHK